MDIFEKCYGFKDAQAAREGGYYPYFIPIEENYGSKVKMKGREVIMCGSNNYLGLAQDPRVQEAAKQAIEKYGTSCSGSRFMNGTLTLHEELEERLAAFVEKEAALYLDEAHAIGVIGRTGRGTTEHFGNSGLADLIMCTFSKSFGSIGGFIAGQVEVIDYIKHFSRPLIFSASMPPANTAAVLAALNIIEEQPEIVTRAAVPPNRSLIRTSYMAIHGDDELARILNVAEEEGRALGII